MEQMNILIECLESCQNESVNTNGGGLGRKYIAWVSGGSVLREVVGEEHQQRRKSGGWFRF